LACDPGKRNIGLRAAQLLQCDLGEIGLSGHARGGRQPAVGADEINAMSDAFARKTHRLNSGGRWCPAGGRAMMASRGRCTPETGRHAAMQRISAVGHNLPLALSFACAENRCNFLRFLPMT